MQYERAYPGDARYSGPLDCACKIWEEEGLEGFFAGAQANALRTISSAACLVVYGEVKQAFK